MRASGLALPFRDHSVDVCLSSNVAEHVAQPWQLGAEMLRVTRPGGLVILSYTVWLGPFGGHEMGLTHYLGGARAAAATPAGTAIRRRTTSGRHFRGLSGRRAVVGGGHWHAGRRIPRYHPRWAWWLTSVPGLREFAVSNLVLVMRPRSGEMNRF